MDMMTRAGLAEETVLRSAGAAVSTPVPSSGPRWQRKASTACAAAAGSGSKPVVARIVYMGGVCPTGDGRLPAEPDRRGQLSGAIA